MSYYPGQGYHGSGGGGGGGGYDGHNNYNQPPPQQYHQPPPPQQYQQYQQGGSYDGYGHGGGGGGAGDGGGYNSRGPPPPPTGNQNFGQTNMQFQYSDLHGKKKALLIGINYFGSKNELKGCINDVHNMIQFLVEKFGFKRDDMVILTDDQRNPRAIPNRRNIIEAMQWLTAGARPGDNLFLHYSGHGGRTEDTDGDEDDGYDECIYPVDFQQTNPGHIVDDIMHDICVKTLPPGCRLTALFDCCHSGSILDLPYMYSTKGVLKEPNLLKDAGMGLLGIGQSYLRNDMGGMFSGAKGLFDRVSHTVGGNADAVKQQKTAPADVICFTGCKDTQTSADASIGGQGQGAMSYAFRQSLDKYRGQLNYLQLLNVIREEMTNGGYEQKPQLSACHPIDLNLAFTL